MQFFVIIKVTEKLEKKGKGHARIRSVSTLTKHLKMKFERDPERVYLTGPGCPLPAPQSSVFLIEG